MMNISHRILLSAGVISPARAVIRGTPSPIEIDATKAAGPSQAGNSTPISKTASLFRRSAPACLNARNRCQIFRQSWIRSPCFWIYIPKVGLNYATW